MSKWYNVAIREMATLPNFKAEPSWIQKNLKSKVPLSEIQKSLNFLFERNFLTKDKNGKIQQKEKLLDCWGGVHKLALSQYHTQVLNVAADSITLPLARKET